MESGLTGPDHIVKAEPDASEAATRITQLNEDSDAGIETQRVTVAPLFPVRFPLHASQDGDLGPFWPASGRVAVDHVLIARNSARELNRSIGHEFDYAWLWPRWLHGGGVGPGSLECVVERLAGNLIAASNLSNGDSHIDHCPAGFHVFFAELALVHALSLG